MQGASVYRVDVASPEEMGTLAAACAHACFEDDVFLLSGALGAGKTVFARYFIEAISDGARVVSPTFPVMQEYETHKGLLRHFDLYRLKRYEELFHIGLEDAMARGVVLVEWPDVAADFFPEDSVRVEITTPLGADGARTVSVSGAEHVVSALKAARR
jgi:tRNA threonylcarbamoyl adenosine modification protein YjeE